MILVRKECQESAGHSFLNSFQLTTSPRTGWGENETKNCLYILEKLLVLKMQILNITNLIQAFKKSPKGTDKHTPEMPIIWEAQFEFQNFSSAQSPFSDETLMPLHII